MRLFLSLLLILIICFFLPTTVSTLFAPPERSPSSVHAVAWPIGDRIGVSFFRCWTSFSYVCMPLCTLGTESLLPSLFSHAAEAGVEPSPHRAPRARGWRGAARSAAHARRIGSNPKCAASRSRRRDVVLPPLHEPWAMTLPQDAPARPCATLRLGIPCGAAPPAPPVRGGMRRGGEGRRRWIEHRGSSFYIFIVLALSGPPGN